MRLLALHLLLQHRELFAAGLRRCSGVLYGPPGAQRAHSMQHACRQAACVGALALRVSPVSSALELHAASA